MVATDDDSGRVTRSLNGDPEAFAELIGQHQHMIHALCYRMTGSLAEADDLAQDTFIHAHRHLKDFRAEARFSSWLYRIAVNLCRNWRKRRQRLAMALATRYRERGRPGEAVARPRIAKAGGDAKVAGELNKMESLLTPDQ